MGSKAETKPVGFDLSPLLPHIGYIAKAAINLTDAEPLHAEAHKILKMLESADKPHSISCVGEVLQLAVATISNLIRTAPTHSALLQKEENRKDAKKARDDRVKAEGREKVKQAMLKLEKEGKPITVLQLRWEINMIYGDAGQRSPGNLMLPSPDYHMSIATIKRRLSEIAETD